MSVSRARRTVRVENVLCWHASAVSDRASAGRGKRRGNARDEDGAVDGERTLDGVRLELAVDLDGLFGDRGVVRGREGDAHGALVWLGEIVRRWGRGDGGRGSYMVCQSDGGGEDMVRAEREGRRRAECPGRKLSSGRQFCPIVDMFVHRVSSTT